MSEKKFVNKHIPGYTPNNLKWYERDDLLIYIDQLKYEEFSSDLDRYLKKAEIINFDFIDKRCRSDTQKFSDKYYQTVVSKDVEKMPQSHFKKSATSTVTSFSI